MAPCNIIYRKVVSCFLVVALIAIAVFFTLDSPIGASASYASAAPVPPYEPAAGPKDKMGAWFMVPKPPPEDQMQAVHTILLPSGKVLIANGSSNRSRLENGEILNGVDTKKQEVVDNTALFDPSLSDPDRDLISDLEPDYGSNSLERIPSPLTPLNGEANDLFCSGHLHLPNGNVLFAGGNRLYYPGGTFRGSRQTNIFDWQTNTWSSAGVMHDGRWYPTLVPLDDGKIAIFSGLRFGNVETNSDVEVYDPNAAPEDAWQRIDLKNIPHSPFNTPMINTAREKFPLSLFLNKPSTGPDILDLYPRIFPTPDGRFLITGDGGGKAPLAVPNSTNTYLMSIDADSSGKLSIRFDPEQPQRQARNKGYGTALLDPNSNDILMLGGIIGTNDIQFGSPYNAANNKIFKQIGASIASSLERWNAGTGDSPNGSWELEKNFLGRPWAMPQAVILPTKEILVMEGGRYGETQGYTDPLLLTPEPSAPGSYTTQLMNSARIPRLYHNNAVLLPDARVLSIGGNPSQAIRDVTTGAIYTNTQPNENGDIQFVYPPYPDGFVPAESWQAEIFSPPYLFHPGDRPEISQAPTQLHYSTSASIAVAHSLSRPASPATTETTVLKQSSLVLIKLSSNTHSLDSGQRLADLPIETVSFNDDANDETVPKNTTLNFSVPTNSHLYPPGYYMLFYVNEIGKPSHAKMVQLMK